ncbi:MAG: hypothetical protein ACYCVN_07915 [Acidimicrobiales bacterium]
MVDESVRPRGAVVLEPDEFTVTGSGEIASGPEESPLAGPRSALDEGRRRFILASVVGTALVAVPYLWILWGPWASPDPIRKTPYEDNFYSLQARAMFHGHLYLAKGAIGIEAFVHDGHQYTYFGLFPSIIRMPVLLVTSALDVRLTAPSMLLAWLLTALFSSLLLWRVRVLVRGDVVMSRAEAASFGALVATILGGTVLIYLAETPFVFSEDLAWSVCLTVASLFALLGVIERPSWGRVTAAGLLILCANLDRATTGYATAAGAILLAGWFWLERGGSEHRRWWFPVLLTGVIPVLVAMAVNLAKFGIPIGVPVANQVWTQINAHRRQFLAAHHNSEIGLDFVPSTAWAYLQPFGLRFTSVFPYITLPARPAAAMSGILFDRLYRTDSLPASTPLLFLLSCWGLITAFRPRPLGRLAPIRLLMLGAGAACVALLLWGYIAPRYLADFVPLLVLAGAVAMVDIWRRMDGRSRRMRIGALSVIAVVGLFSIAANIGTAITPNEEWSSTQVINYVRAQEALSSITGGPLRGNVTRGTVLPPYAPADQLYVIGNCDGLYISDGQNYSTVPAQQYQRSTWMAVQRGPGFEQTFDVTVNRLRTPAAVSQTLVTAGTTTILVSVLPSTGRLVRMVFSLHGPNGNMYGEAYVAPGSTHKLAVVTDQAKHQAEVAMDGESYLSGVLSPGSPAVPGTERSSTGGPRPTLAVVNTTASSPPRLCQTIDHLGRAGPRT